MKLKRKLNKSQMIYGMEINNRKKNKIMKINELIMN